MFKQVLFDDFDAMLLSSLVYNTQNIQLRSKYKKYFFIQDSSVGSCSELVNCTRLQYLAILYLNTGLELQIIVTQFPRIKQITNLSNLKYMPARFYLSHQFQLYAYSPDHLTALSGQIIRVQQTDSFRLTGFISGLSTARKSFLFTESSHLLKIILALK